MTRCVYTDPRPGDVVQVVPTVCDRLPEPLQILEVDQYGVRWHRPIAEQECKTIWRVWNSNGSVAGFHRRMELVEARAGGEVPA